MLVKRFGVVSVTFAIGSAKGSQNPPQALPEGFGHRTQTLAQRFWNTSTLSPTHTTNIGLRTLAFVFGWSWVGYTMPFLLDIPFGLAYRIP
jgi:hypothetical protein